MNKSLTFIITIIFILHTHLLIAQDESDESESSQEESTAAESSVTNSATAPAAPVSGAIEGNPIISMLRQGRSLEDIKQAIATFGLAGLQQKALKYGTDKDPNLSEEVLSASASLSSSIQDAITALTNEEWYNETYQTALVEAASLAGELLIDRTITDAKDLPNSINISSFTDNRYNVAFIHLLSKYGAIGSSSSDSIVTDILGTDLATGLSGNANVSDKNLFSYLPYLSLYSGGPTLSEDNIPSDLNIPLSNVSLAPGNVITIGSAADPSKIDVSKHLESAQSIHGNYKVYTIGAAKDININGNVIFENDNDVEDHALVIAAADNFKLNYDSQDVKRSIVYEGSNLALAAGNKDEDSMYLINTEINTGGNLAVGSLGTLNMTTVDLAVGTGGTNSDPDNIYLFASDVINITGLNFTGGNVNDIYMAAKTINLTNVNFPAASNVSLNSELGKPNFTGQLPGYINFENVKHGLTTLSESSFANGDFISETGSVKLGKL
jgi:hypothetical protein